MSLTMDADPVASSAALLSAVPLVGVSITKGSEPGADILREEFGLFHRREVAAAGHLRPTLYVEETLSPFTRRMTDVFWKECESRWD
jgi:hypothetical protein